MATWFDHEHDLDDHRSPMRVPEYDDLCGRSLPQLQELRRARLVRLVLAIGALCSGALIAALPLGALLVVPATVLFVLGLIATPIAVYLLRSVIREITAHEVEAAYHRDRPQQG